MATTDASGAFHFDGHSHLEWPAPLLLEDHFVAWKLCFGDPRMPGAALFAMDSGTKVRDHALTCSIESGKERHLLFAHKPRPEPGSCFVAERF